MVALRGISPADTEMEDWSPYVAHATPNVKEMLVDLRKVLQKPRVGLKGKTSEGMERLFECCDGGDVVDRSAVERRQRHIRSSGNAQRTSRERPKDVVVAQPRRILNYVFLYFSYISSECPWDRTLSSHHIQEAF